MTLYTQVPVTERLPIPDTSVFMGNTKDEWVSSGYHVCGLWFNDYDHDCPCYPEYWLEPITFPTDGELITYIIQNALKGLNREQLQAVTRALVERSGLVPTEDEIQYATRCYADDHHGDDIAWESIKTRTKFRAGVNWILNKLRS